jgi:hypothetical protein
VSHVDQNSRSPRYDVGLHRILSEAENKGQYGDVPWCNISGIIQQLCQLPYSCILRILRFSYFKIIHAPNIKDKIRRQHNFKPRGAFEWTDKHDAVPPRDQLSS